MPRITGGAKYRAGFEFRTDGTRPGEPRQDPWGGTLIEGVPPSEEAFLHPAVYESRPQGQAVVHLHSTCWGCGGPWGYTRRIERSVKQLLADGRCLPARLGGTTGTMYHMDRPLAEKVSPAKTDSVYLVYLPAGGTTGIDLSDFPGTFTVRWFDPRHGGSLQQGSVTQVEGGQFPFQADNGAAEQGDADLGSEGPCQGIELGHQVTSQFCVVPISQARRKMTSGARADSKRLPVIV